MPKREQKFYLKNEAEVMRDLGLTPTKGSGSGWIEKEDGYNEHVLAQLKSTDAQSIRIKLHDIRKLELNASTSHKIPVFVIQFLKSDDIFILARPMDLPNIAKYIETGVCEKYNVIDVTTNDDLIVNQQKVIKSGNRQKFWAEKEKEWNDAKRKRKG